MDAGTVQADATTRTLSTTAAALPGLGLAGYRAIEARAADALPQWTVHLAPPADVAPPAIRFVQGVLNGDGLDAAAWASARSQRALLVTGGTPAQRRAVADGLTSRGGRAEIGAGGGTIRLTWAPVPPKADAVDQSSPAQGDGRPQD